MCVLAVGAVNALFMTPNSDWFASLIRPEMNADLHSVLWLFFYLLTAAVIAEFIIEKRLRRYFWSVVVLFICNPLWCFVFFRLHSAVAAFVILILTVADLIYITVVLSYKTKWHWILGVAITCWYISLTALNAVILALNC